MQGRCPMIVDGTDVCPVIEQQSRRARRRRVLAHEPAVAYWPEASLASTIAPRSSRSAATPGRS